MSRIAIALILGTVFSPAAFAQHLGLNKGDSLEVVRRKTSGLKPITGETGLYSATSLPLNPPGNDNDYRLQIGKKTGLCQIRVYWSIRNDSRYGDRVKAKFKELETALDKKYSTGNKYKFLRAGALWDEKEDFMMSLLKDERYHSSYWNDNDGHKIPANTQTISLDVNGTSRSSSLIELTYEFNNIDQCINESNEADNSML